MSLGGLHTTPLGHDADFDVAAHRVFSSTGRDVSDVWVDGWRLVASGPADDIRRRDGQAPAQAAAEELFESRAAG